MVRTKGHPDSRKIRSFSTNLETWLIDCIRERDPGLLSDTKWMYKNLWHELIRQMQVSEKRIKSSYELSLKLCDK